jgi:hypothetical protein
MPLVIRATAAPQAARNTAQFRARRRQRRILHSRRVIRRRGACLFWFIDIGSLLTSFRNAQPHNYIILLYTSFAGV